MSDGFYLRDEIHKTIKNEDVVHKDVLFFKLERANFDGKATKDHVKGYKAHFSEFLKANPSYKLPDHLSEVEIGSPKVGEGFGHPVAVEPEAKKAKK